MNEYIGGWDITTLVDPGKPKPTEPQQKKKKRKTKVTQAMVDHVVAHPELSAKELAAELGLSYHTIHNIRQKLGLEVKRDYRASTLRAEAVVREHAPKRASIKAMAALAKVNIHTIYNAMERLGFDYGPNYRTEVHRATALHMIAVRECTEDSKRRQVESRRKSLAREYRRREYGLPPKKKFRLRMPRSTSLLRSTLNHIARNFGYVTERVVGDIAYYTPETRRRFNCRYDENYYSDKYGIRFLPMPGAWREEVTENEEEDEDLC